MLRHLMVVGQVGLLVGERVRVQHDGQRRAVASMQSGSSEVVNRRQSKQTILGTVLQSHHEG